MCVSFFFLSFAYFDKQHAERIQITRTRTVRCFQLCIASIGLIHTELEKEDQRRSGSWWIIQHDVRAESLLLHDNHQLRAVHNLVDPRRKLHHVNENFTPLAFSIYTRWWCDAPEVPFWSVCCEEYTTTATIEQIIVITLHTKSSSWFQISETFVIATTLNRFHS